MFVDTLKNLAAKKHVSYSETSKNNQAHKKSHVSLAETRRYSWFGNLLDETNLSSSNHQSKKEEELLTALDLKTDRTSPMEATVLETKKNTGFNELSSGKNDLTFLSMVG